MLVNYLNETYRLVFKSIRSSHFGLIWDGSFYSDPLRMDKYVLEEIIRLRLNLL